MTTSAVAGLVHVQARGMVRAADIAYARHKVEAALHHAHEPVLFARARLTRLPDPALARPSVVEVNVDLRGRPVRVQVARPSMREAIDAVHDRLRERLRRAARDWESVRGSRPLDVAHEWRHESQPTERPDFFPRPVEDRQIVRRKTFSLHRLTVDEAAFELEMLGHDFHLFTEEGTGADSVLVRDDLGHHLHQLRPRREGITGGATPLTVEPAAPAAMTTEEAVARLNATGEPFVFFRDVESERGCVLYHRYDGHYGLITPAT